MPGDAIFPGRKLGFGLMRLPTGEDGQIDIARVSALADRFLAEGYTYFDTAYMYGGSEEAFRRAVVERYPRSAYTIADKMACWVMNSQLGAKEMFEESLRRTGVEYFDYYLLHSLQASRNEDYDRYGCWDFCAAMKREGRIRRFGFSFHGEPELLEDLLTRHPEVDFVQLQLNYVDWESNAIWSRANWEVCRRHGKPMVVMEPVKGGFLANLSPEVTRELDALRPGLSPAGWALTFAATLPGVGMVLSGMNGMEQMEDNTAVFRGLQPLSEAEQAALCGVRERILSQPTIQCTACRYCTKGCPMGINIPEIFKAENMLLTFGEHIRPHLYYGGLLKTGSARASDCVACGQCEAACPQHLPIIRLLQDASAHLDKE